MSARERGETPLMKQYYRIKGENPGAVLLFRMGDFYETFGEDARHVAPILGITLTKRSNGKASDVALAGFPHHALDTYLPKLIRAGLRVAICEQVEDPKTAGKLVKRDVVEVVSPGVSLREQMLEPSEPAFLASLHGFHGEREAGLALLDASTGEFSVIEVDHARLVNLIDTYNPAEIIIEKRSREDYPSQIFRGRVVTELDDWMYTSEFARECLLQHFGTHSLKGFGIEDLEVGIVAAGVALQYVKDAQKISPKYIRHVHRVDDSEYMVLDQQTRRNLELVNTIGGNSRDDSLLGILDRSRTPMGARMLRRWLLSPLRKPEHINQRLEAVSRVVDRANLRTGLQEELANTGDLERLSTRISIGRASPRDLIQLKLSLARIPHLKKLAGETGGAAWSDCNSKLTLENDAVDRIQKVLIDEPPATLVKGGVIRDGYDERLDELRDITRSGKEWIARLQKDESERTGIPSLKIGFNKVFGYYLEVTNAHKSRVPDDYIRKQTLVNSERYITPALKEYEEKVLTAEEKIVSLEQEIFETLRLSLAERTDSIMRNAAAVATIDCYCSLAEVAVANNYVRPTVDDSDLLDIDNGRHPVVESRLPPGESFIPNSVRLDPSSEQILIITGPNMAGKSVVLRQTGLIVLMAHIGSYVPATKAHIGAVDRIFTRVGASDNLAEGESTFLVEMNETANILNNATKHSLILLDEVGRGTSTFDGMSIAWSLVEHIHETPAVAARTMFATHYHELNELASTLPRVRNFRILVEEHDDRVIFLRKLVAGGADHSFGIEVARMAGLPDEVIQRAAEILKVLEAQKLKIQAGQGDSGDGSMKPEDDVVTSIPDRTVTPQYSLFQTDPMLEEIASLLESIDTDRLTPVEALLKLVELKSKLPARR